MARRSTPLSSWAISSVDGTGPLEVLSNAPDYDTQFANPGPSASTRMCSLLRENSIADTGDPELSRPYLNRILAIMPDEISRCSRLSWVDPTVRIDRRQDDRRAGFCTEKYCRRKCTNVGDPPEWQTKVVEYKTCECR
jgi:hypothetical protein